jgi:DNA-binding CsgD family transcriptional regulator
MAGHLNGIDGFIDAVSAARTPRQVWGSMEKFCHHNDFGSLAYIITSREQPDGHLIEETSNLAGQFDQDYVEENAFRFDPFLNFGCKSYLPLNFGTMFADDLPGLTKRQLEFFQYAAESGISMAFGVPVALCQDKEFGGWIVGCGSGTRRQFKLLQKEAAGRVMLASLIAHERMQQLEPLSMDCDGVLSPRERECLIWLSQGLRTAQIAEKLGLSVSAVRLYLVNARKKLGGKTREHAVALAIVRGEVVL